MSFLPFISLFHTSCENEILWKAFIILSTSCPSLLLDESSSYSVPECRNWGGFGVGFFFVVVVFLCSRLYSSRWDLGTSVLLKLISSIFFICLGFFCVYCVLFSLSSTESNCQKDASAFVSFPSTWISQQWVDCCCWKMWRQEWLCLSARCGSQSHCGSDSAE